MKKIFFTILFLMLITTVYLFFKHGLKILMVVSSSMEPIIKKGSLVVIKQEAIYSKGDIITYKNNSGTEIVTHRIERIQKKGDSYFFRTKGDRNDSEDPDAVSQKNIIGKVKLSIPFLNIFYENPVLIRFFFVFLMFVEGYFLGKLSKDTVDKIQV
jgi:signal peptidase